MSGLIYLDNNATTQPLPEVVEAMLPYLRDRYANPSSIHQFGQAARHAVELAREQVAALLGATTREIIFTSGGTESINLAVRGAVAAAPSGRRRIVTTAVEHSAVLRVVEQLEREGHPVCFVGVDRDGRVDGAAWERAIGDDTALASLMHANNETGVISDVPRLAAIAESKGAVVHVDAVQSAGKCSIPVKDWPVHLLSLSAHKFHGPKGAGSLYIRRRTRVMPQVLGGSQERELRGGTENVAAIVGMGVAAVAAMVDRETVCRTVGDLRDELECGILGAIPFASVNGAGSPRICNTTNVSFRSLQAEAILLVLSEAGICASSGSACSSGSLEPSHVLKAMGIEVEQAHGAIRFSLSRFSTSDEVRRVVSMLPGLLSRLTSASARA